MVVISCSLINMLIRWYYFASLMRGIMGDVVVLRKKRASGKLLNPNIEHRTSNIEHRIVGRLWSVILINDLFTTI